MSPFFAPLRPGNVLESPRARIARRDSDRDNLIRKRIEARKGHYLKAGLLESQRVRQMSGRIFLPAFVVWLIIGIPAIAAETNLPEPKSAAVMDFELIDEMRDCAATADKSWLRGIRYMVDSIEEKKQHLR